MSFVIAAPETLVRAASDLANIGSTLGAANAAALGPTTELLAAGADEVSAAIASLFAAHGQAYQAVSAQMSAFHAQFVQTFTAGAGAALCVDHEQVESSDTLPNTKIRGFDGPSVR